MTTEQPKPSAPPGTQPGEGLRPAVPATTRADAASPAVDDPKPAPPPPTKPEETAEPAATPKHVETVQPASTSHLRGMFRRRRRPAAHSATAAASSSSDKSSETAIALADPGTAPRPAAATTDPPQETAGPKKRLEPLPTERPPGAPEDPWTRFATTADRPPGRIRRTTRTISRSLIHEYALATYASLLLAVALTWPALRYPLHTLPQDIWDPSRQAWQISWGGHILMTDPVKLWQSNAFFPEPNSFAFGNSLLGYAPAGMLGDGPLAATLRYNIIFVLAHALLALGGYALVRQLGAGRTGAAVAAVAITYAPWRLAQEGHLDIISAGGIPLALAMLARGHGWSLRRGLRSDHRSVGWAAAGWVVAAWQVSLGFSLGVPFLYVLGLTLAIVLIRLPFRWWRRPTQRPILGWRLLLTDGLGVLVLAGVSALIAFPYSKAPNGSDAKTEIAFFSPPLRSLLIGPAESRIWGAPHEVPRSSLNWPAEMSLLPGFVLYALALAGLAFSIWTLRQRLLLLVTLAGTIILTLGTNFFDGRWTYLPLFGHLPASLGLRIPGRLMLWTTILLSILAAGAVAEFVRRVEHWAEQRIPPWPGPWLRLATLIPLMLILVEGWNATAHPVVPEQPKTMRTVSGPMLVLPTADLTDQTTMLWSTTRFQQLANGAGGFAATRQAELRRNVASFPDPASIDYLRSQRITTVLLLRAEVAGTPWERAGDLPVDGLNITREDLDDAVIFRLN